MLNIIFKNRNTAFLNFQKAIRWFEETFESNIVNIEECNKCKNIKIYILYLNKICIFDSAYFKFYDDKFVNKVCEQTEELLFIFMNKECSMKKKKIKITKLLKKILSKQKFN